MKTNITIIAVDGNPIIAKFIGDFDYEVQSYGPLGEEIRFADVFQVLDGTYVVRLADGLICKAEPSVRFRCYRPQPVKGGKRHRKLARAERTKKPFRMTEDDLPF